MCASILLNLFWDLSTLPRFQNPRLLLKILPETFSAHVVFVNRMTSVARESPTASPSPSSQLPTIQPLPTLFSQFQNPGLFSHWLQKEHILKQNSNLCLSWFVQGVSKSRSSSRSKMEWMSPTRYNPQWSIESQFCLNSRAPGLLRCARFSLCFEWEPWEVNLYSMFFWWSWFVAGWWWRLRTSLWGAKWWLQCWLNFEDLRDVVVNVGMVQLGDGKHYAVISDRGLHSVLRPGQV